MDPLPPGVDPRVTVAPHVMGHRDPTIRLERGSLTRAMRTPEGPGTVRLEWSRQARLDHWGPGGPWLAAQLPELLGATDLPPSRIDGHRLVEQAHRRLPGLRIGANRDPLATLVAAVCGQRVTGVEARWSWAKLVRLTSESAPGPTGLWLPPDPERLRTLASWDYHRCGIDGRRAATIAGLGARARFLERLATTEPNEAGRLVQALAGIGPWSAALLRALSLGDVDAVLVGDYGLPDLVCHALAGERDGTDARMLELLEPFRGQRWRVTRLLELTAEGPARRAPRARIHDIRRL